MFSTNRFVLAAALAALLTATAQAAPVQWTAASGGNDHYYDVVLAPDGITWADANTAAVTAGGYLATITSAAEAAFILDLVDDSSMFWIVVGDGTRGPWLGGLQADGSVEPEEGWQWMTGEAFAFTNWAAGEPNNNLSDESFLHLYHAVVDPVAATWNDLSNESGPLNPVAYVVELVPEPSSLLLAASGLCGVLLLKRRG